MSDFGRGGLTGWGRSVINMTHKSLMSVWSYMTISVDQEVIVMLNMEEARSNSGRNERRAGEHRMNQATNREMGPFEGGTVFLGGDSGRGHELMTRVREIGSPNRSEEHHPVTFWTPDGSRHAGMTPRVSGEMIFIESERMVPVGTDITVSLAPLEKQSEAQELAEGTVVWHCPLGDEFENHGGVGVRLQKRWPKGPSLVGGMKEPA